MEPLIAPPEPAVHPLISSSYANATNASHIEDQLLSRCVEASALKIQAVSSNELASAQSALDFPVQVELVFNRQITQLQNDAFLKLGGQITHIYRAVSYGWNGIIPLGQISRLPALMGSSLVLVEEDKSIVKHMEISGRTGRSRAVWAPGFAGNAGGFSGNTNITVAIIDDGVDSSHADLAGRCVYWQDFSTDGASLPTDIQEHGSHVASIAIGSGAASGNVESNLYVTLFGTLSGVLSGNFFVSPMELPTNTNPITLAATARWNGGGTGTLEFTTHPKGTKTGYVVTGTTASGTSPVSLSTTITPNASNEYSVVLVSNGKMTDYVITYTVPTYPAVDSFNRMRGVAPGCNWAGAKVFTSTGGGNLSWTGAAIDDLVAKRVANNVKVMNLSLGATGTPGISTTVRQKVNTAVNNGIVVTASAGNTGANTSGSAREVSDPGRAAMALTVAAANDVNQLTDFSCNGFTTLSTSSGQEEDYKPDLIAPGGSSYYSYILGVDANTGDGSAFSDQQTNDYYLTSGTSMSAPFAAGAAALVIDALQHGGLNWDFNSSKNSLLVKMLLCATSTETATNREGNANNPTLQRDSAAPGGLPVGKDLYEGYGMINPDAAVEAVAQTLVFGMTNTATLGPTQFDPRAWACSVNLLAGVNFSAALTVPATGDFDLYLYSQTPSTYGAPQILVSSSTSGSGVAENISYTPSSNATAYLVVKKVSGAGTFNLIGNIPPQPAQLVVNPINLDFGLVTVGSNSLRYLVVSNSGGMVLTGSASVVDTNFTLIAGSPFSIAAGTYTNFAVSFVPAGSGSFSNNLVFYSNAGGLSVPVTGRALEAPAIQSPQLNQNGLTFSFPTVSGFNYVVQYKDHVDDAAWSFLETHPGTGAMQYITTPTNLVGQRYFRVVVQ